ncbi:MAG: hypothetical protein H7A26_04040 [Spirochaetales bacterium]|nr:hypothetical protein [Spirochaetales bacterium]
MRGLLARAKDYLEKESIRLNKTASKKMEEEQQKEIMAEMDAILEKNRLKINEKTIDFNVQSSDVVFPLVLNISAAAVLVVLVIIFYFAFNQNEKKLLSESGNVKSEVEGRIVEAVKKAAEKEIQDREDEIRSFRMKLEQAEDSRKALVSAAEERIRQQVELYKTELQRDIDAEKQRLSGSGLSEEEIKKRIEVYEKNKQMETDEKAAAARKEIEDNFKIKSKEFDDQIAEYSTSLARKQDEIANLKSSMEQDLAASRQESEMLRKKAEADEQNFLLKLAELKKQQEEIAIIESRIMGMYTAVNSSLKKNDYAAAGEQLNLLEDFINSPLTVRLTEQTASASERRKIDRILTDTMRRLIDLEIAGRTPPQQVPLQMELSEEEKDLLSRAQSADVRRDTLIRELGNMQTRYKNSPDSDKSSSLKVMIKLLNSKLLLRQALTSEEVLKKYPELYKTTDEIFELYGRDQREAGRNEALQDIVAITDYLNRRKNSNSPPPGDAAMDAGQRELLIDFLQNLQRLLDEPAGR